MTTKAGGFKLRSRPRSEKLRDSPAGDRLTLVRLFLKKELLKRAGGTWNVNQVAKALDISRQAVDKRRDRGALLAVPSGQGDYLYPRCQFTADGVIPELDTVLRSFRVHSPWTQLSALLAPAATLDGEQVLKALKKGNVEGAVSAVSSIGDTLDDAAPEV